MMESEPRPFNQTKSWGELHQHVKDARKLQAKLTNTMVENLLKCIIIIVISPLNSEVNHVMQYDPDSKVN